MRAFLKIAHDVQGFSLALLRLNQDERILKFLSQLDGQYVQTIPKQEVSHVIEALIDSGDLFPGGERTLFSFDTALRLHRIFHQLLRRFSSHEERFDLFAQAITRSINSIYTLVYELKEQGKEHIETEDTFIPQEERDFTSDELYRLRQLAVEKIQVWADNGRLVEHPQLLPLLYAWKEWGNVESCQRYVAHIVKEDRGLLAFLYAALKEAVQVAIKQEVIQPEWKKYIVHIEDFIPADNLIEHARALFQDDYFVKLKETEQLTLMIFLDLVSPDTQKVFPKTMP